MRDFINLNLQIARVAEQFRRENLSAGEQLAEALRTRQMEADSGIGAALRDISQLVERRDVLMGVIGEQQRFMENVVSAAQPRLATASIARMIEPLSQIAAVKSHFADFASGWKPLISPIVEFQNKLEEGIPAIQAHLSQMQRFASLADVSLFIATSSLADIAPGAVHFSLNSAVENAVRLSQSFGGLVESLESAPLGILGIQPAWSGLSAAELFTNSDLAAQAVVVKWPPEVAEEENAVRDEIREETTDVLRALVESLDSGLSQLLDGSDKAFSERGPDFVRHFAASLRELFTHVLHRLSPDEEIKRWSMSDEDFDRGRPTRRARIRYICRSINHGPCVRFVEADISAALSFVDLFQSGTHSVASAFNDAQLAALKLRMELLIRYLIEVSLFEN